MGMLISERKRISFRASYLSVARRQVKRITKTIREFHPVIFLFAGRVVNSFSKLSRSSRINIWLPLESRMAGSGILYPGSRRTAVKSENNGSLI